MEINIVDTVDPSLVRIEMTLTALNQTVISMGAGPNAVERMVTKVIEKVKTPGKLNVLRIHSHGNSGVINIAGGTIDESDTLSAISISNFPQITGSLERLTPYFHPQGRVELVGCEVAVDGNGKITENSDGERLLKQLAKIWHVNVLASGNPKGLPLGSVKFIGLVVQATPAGGLSCAPAPDVTKIR